MGGTPAPSEPTLAGGGATDARPCNIPGCGNDIIGGAPGGGNAPPLGGGGTFGINGNRFGNPIGGGAPGGKRIPGGRPCGSIGGPFGGFMPAKGGGANALLALNAAAL